MNPNVRPPPRIFFVHDGYDVQPYVDYLEAAGLHVVAADGDGNTVEAVVSANPDLIVLDFEHNGDTAAVLKNDARTRHIPIIALTDLAKLSRARPYGANN